MLNGLNVEWYSKSEQNGSHIVTTHSKMDQNGNHFEFDHWKMDQNGSHFEFDHCKSKFLYRLDFEYLVFKTPLYAEKTR